MTDAQQGDGVDVIGIVVAGVAGQPVFDVASRLAALCAADPESVSVSGNPDARPGQSVEAHARLGRATGAPAPRVMPGECRLIVGLEPLEALRCAHAYGSPGTAVVCLTESLLPTSVVHAGASYPDPGAASQDLSRLGIEMTWVDGAADGRSLDDLVRVAAAALDGRG